jgi:hypothetical protein
MSGLLTSGLFLLFSRSPKEELPSAKPRQTTMDRFISSKGESEVYHGKTLMPVNTKMIADAWNCRTKDFMVINNTAVSSVST